MIKWNNEDGTINWQKSDLSRLRKAVNNFNSKRRRLIKNEQNLEKENQVILNTIEKESFSKIKKEILTREQLNAYINDLRGFSKRGAETIDKKHFEETGQKITKWQKNVINRNIKIAKIRLNKELEPYKQIIEDSGGLSKIDMKNTEAQAIINRIEALENYKLKSGYDYFKKINSIRNQGNFDYTLKKAINYRDNYIEVMQKYAGRPRI